MQDWGDSAFFKIKVISKVFMKTTRVCVPLQIWFGTNRVIYESLCNMITKGNLQNNVSGFHPNELLKLTSIYLRFFIQWLSGEERLPVVYVIWWIFLQKKKQWLFHLMLNINHVSSQLKHHIFVYIVIKDLPHWYTLTNRLLKLNKNYK